jgi:hypothetical protein
VFKELFENVNNGRKINLLNNGKDIKQTGKTSWVYTGKYPEDVVKYLQKKLSKIVKFEEVKGENIGDGWLLRSVDKKHEIYISNFRGKTTIEYIKGSEDLVT